jgi:hypothetical protein
MRFSAMSIAVGVVFVLSATPESALGQAEDHLKCYKVKDPLILKHPVPPAEKEWLELTGSQFGSENCRIVGGFRLFCVPVTKTVLTDPRGKLKTESGPPVSFTPTPVPGITEQDKICYKIKCLDSFPSPPNPQQFVQDQFRSRFVTELKPFLLCGPAAKGLETDPFPNSLAKVVVSSFFGTEYVTLSGPTTVEVHFAGLADTDGDNLEQVETEIVSMSLTGTSTLGLGAITLRVRDPSKDPFQASLGEIEENANNTPGILDVPPFASSGDAESFFDVFFEIDTEFLPGLTLHNGVPKRMSTTITHKPPGEGETYFSPELIELLDEDGNPVGVFIGSANHTPDPSDCLDTFPACNGSCPQGEVCRNTGTACVCLPPEPIGCQGTSAPQCDGFCPSDFVCQEEIGGCECVPLFLP